MTSLATRPRGLAERSVLLPASLSAPRTARRALAGVPELAEQDELLFVAQLLTAELVSNVLRHSNLRPGSEFLLRIECDEQSLAVEVSDRGVGFNPLLLLREHALSDARHRGLALIDALADRWGFVSGTGCRVWFELELVPGRRAWRGREPIPRA